MKPSDRQPVSDRQHPAQAQPAASSSGSPMPLVYPDGRVRTIWLQEHYSQPAS